MTDWTIISRSLKARLFSTVTTVVTVGVAVALMLVLLTMRDSGRRAFERGSRDMLRGGRPREGRQDAADAWVPHLRERRRDARAPGVPVHGRGNLEAHGAGPRPPVLHQQRERLDHRRPRPAGRGRAQRAGRRG